LSVHLAELGGTWNTIPVPRILFFFLIFFNERGRGKNLGFP